MVALIISAGTDFSGSAFLPVARRELGTLFAVEGAEKMGQSSSPSLVNFAKAQGAIGRRNGCALFLGPAKKNENYKLTQPSSSFSIFSVFRAHIN
jgi:hypothetical protein